jgi:hypothetical protein
MDKFEQRFAIIFFFIEGLGSKAIHIKFETALSVTVYSLRQVNECVGRFQTGHFSCQGYSPRNVNVGIESDESGMINGDQRTSTISIAGGYGMVVTQSRVPLLQPQDHHVKGWP